MKIWCLLLAILPMTAAAQADYATQWPLQLARADGGAYRVQLDASVYRQLQSPALQDLAVLNADGEALPMAVLPVTPERDSRQQPVPWFVWPADGRKPGKAWQLSTRFDADGRLRVFRLAGDADAQAPGTPATLLFDLRDLPRPVIALELDWDAPGSLDLGYRIEASNDLEHWRRLPASGRLIDLQRAGHRLLQRRIELGNGSDARYLRLTPDNDDTAIAITGVEAVLAADALPTPQWLELQASDGGSARVFEYRLDGRFPIRQIDARLPGNHVVQWQLQSREDDAGAWQSRVDAWLGYRVETAGGGSRSGPRVLGRTVRDRHWRLQADAPLAEAPVLRLGYTPDTVVFLARGPTPYRLVAGSASARRQSSPLPQLLAELRAQHGPDWQPAQATLGPSQELAGADALTPRRDWTTWLLWGVLALGALLVAWLALGLLRGARPPSG